MAHSRGADTPLRRPGGLAVVVALLLATTVAEAGDLDVRVVDGRVSINATAVPLGELLTTLDRAAGTESTIGPALQGRNVSVQFSDLELGGAIDKIFQGLGLDYVVVGGRRILVTAVSGVAAPNAGPGGAVTSLPSAVTVGAAQPASNPFQVPGVQAGRTVNPGGAQPAVVQTPFGPLLNPRAAGGQAEPATPLSVPGQASSPFGLPVGAASGQPSQSPNNLFGNTSPPILDLNKQQPETRPTFPAIPQTSPSPSAQR